MNIYRKALAELRKRGWAQQTIMDPHGRVCLVGALTYADPCLSFDQTRYDLLLCKVIDEQFPGRLHRYANGRTPLWEFNDNSKTTLADVELVLEKAALIEEEQVQ